MMYLRPTPPSSTLKKKKKKKVIHTHTYPSKRLSGHLLSPYLGKSYLLRTLYSLKIIKSDRAWCLQITIFIFLVGYLRISDSIYTSEGFIYTVQNCSQHNDLTHEYIVTALALQWVKHLLFLHGIFILPVHLHWL